MIREKRELLTLFNMDIAYDEDIEDALDHGYIVSNLAYRLASELGRDEEYCRNIADIGMVHDIGKLRLGEHLYGRRKDALKIEEMKYVRMHPTIGFEILNEQNIGDDNFRSAVLHHHENYDGTGYPDNLKGSDIPEEARILRICDVYAALISERPYRDAFDSNTAIELMIDEVKNFDMEIFLAFMRVIHDDSFNDIEDFVRRINRKVHIKEK